MNRVAKQLIVWIMATVAVALVQPLSAICIVGTAHAQGAPRVSTKVVPPAPEAGQAFQLVFSIMSDSGVGRVASPTLRVPQTLAASGPRIGTQTSMRIVNGVTTRESGATVTWTLVAEKPGRYALGAPTVELDGRTITGEAVTIEVGAPGSSSLLSPFPSSPFSSPFFNFPNNPFDLDDRIDDDTGASAELALPKALDSDLFLRAVADKSTAFVGEQVTLSFYVYYRVDFEMTERHEAALSDFLRFPILTDPASTSSQYTRVAGDRWGVRLIDRVALFPVKAGKLSTGSLAARFKGRRIGARVLRTSNDVVIDAVEPPEAGRPAGYVLGDVGNYQLTATVSPRSGKVGDAITVMVRLEGVGNVPASIRAPANSRVEWLEPEKKESISARGGKVAGYRTFGFVVMLKQPGRIELGKLELASFDPEAKTYKVTQVDLGSIEVVGNAAQPANGEEQSEAQRATAFVAQLPAPRTVLLAYTPEQKLSVSTSFWFLGLAPLVALSLVVSLRIRERVKAQDLTSGPRLPKVEDALKDVFRAQKGGDVSSAARAAEAAVYSAIHQVLTRNPRGMPNHEIERALDAAAVPLEVVAQVVSFLRKVEQIRFLPPGASDASVMLGEEAAEITQLLLTRK